MAYQSEPSTRDERIIVVMGPTGAGKTTFINCVAKRGDLGVGHDIESYTAQVQSIRVQHLIHGRKVVFVDTPGFDDTYTSDVEILTMIAEFLIRSYRNKIQIDTVLYLHRITDKRMTGSLLKNLRMFVSLCGVQSMPTVTIVTTMWDEVNESQGSKREEALKKKMWFDMIEKGCAVKRFHGTYQSAMEILSPEHEIVDGLLLSSEMVGKRKKLKATAAGSELAKEIKSLLKQRKAASRKLQQQSKQAANEAEKQNLEEELEETNEQVNKAKKQHSSLKRNIFERLLGAKPETSLVPQVGSIQWNQST